MSRTQFPLPLRQGLLKTRFVLLPLIGGMTLFLGACEFQTQTGNFKLTAQNRVLQVARIPTTPPPPPSQQAGKIPLTSKKKKASPSPTAVAEIHSTPTSDSEPAPSPSPVENPDQPEIAENTWDGGYDPWADPLALGAPTPSPSPSNEMLALLDKEEKEDASGLGSLSVSANSEDAVETQLAKFEEFLKSLIDPVSGEPIYAEPGANSNYEEEYSDLAAQKAADLVRDKIAFDTFKAVYERLSTIQDPDLDQNRDTGIQDFRVYRGIAAVDKAQEFANRKLDLARYEETLQYFQNLKDNNDRYVLSVETASQISMELCATSNFSLDSFSSAWQAKVTEGQTPAIPLIHTCLTELSIPMDWGKVPAIGSSLLATSQQ